jgi:hypothetical protein
LDDPVSKATDITFEQGPDDATANAALQDAIRGAVEAAGFVFDRLSVVNVGGGQTKSIVVARDAAGLSWGFCCLPDEPGRDAIVGLPLDVAAQANASPTVVGYVEWSTELRGAKC